MEQGYNLLQTRIGQGWKTSQLLLLLVTLFHFKITLLMAPIDDRASYFLGKPIDSLALFLNERVQKRGKTNQQVISEHVKRLF